jgi:Ca-activated chloride channel family protein
MTPSKRSWSAVLVVLLAVASSGCSPGATVPPTAGPTARPTAAPITLVAPPEAKAGETISVGWTGAEVLGDYLVIVPVGTTRYVESADSPYVNVTLGNPASLVAPATPGAYEIWFVTGDTDDQVKARSALTVT